MGTTHLLTEERQGTFHFTMGPYSTPVLQIQPGDRVTVETRDAFGGVIHTEADLPSAKLTHAVREPAERADHGGGRREGRRAGGATSSRWNRVATTRGARAP